MKTDNELIEIGEIELREEAASLDLFDASCWLGKTPAFPLMQEGTPGLLQKIQYDCYIKEALVSHWMSAEDCSQDANRTLLREIENHNGWHAVITLQPLFPADPDSPALPGWAWSEEIKAVRVFPAKFGYALVSWCVGSLCDMLIDKHLPLIVMHTETTFQDLYNLAVCYPKLQIILESQPKKILYHMRMILPLLKDCPNIHLEMSNCCGQGMIDYITNELGPEKLIFGTFAPAQDPLVPLGQLLQARISREAKLAIAGGNLRRMISEVKQ